MTSTPPFEEPMLPPEAMQMFLHRLVHTSGKQLKIAVLWKYFAEAFSYRPGGLENRKWLQRALQEAADQGIIRLPSMRGGCWDHTLEPPLPTVVWKIPPEEGRVDDESWRDYPWLPQLRWVTDMLMLSQEQEIFLKRVQEALREGRLQRSAPLTYRSLQLTGNEKRLGELLHSALFRPGRLSLGLLGCVPDIPPLVIEEIGASPVALIFENAAAFRTAAMLLKQYTSPLYGWLGFGSGASFERSILHFTLVEHQIERIEYVGDLDRHGLRIARGAAELARSEHLPPVVPAWGLHRAMLQSVQQFGYPEGLEYQPRERRSDASDEALVAWLPEDVRRDVLKIIQAGKRVPEEVLGPDELLRVWQCKGDNY
jgi:hypothetical protein